jgi:hypothetical protein
MTGYRIPEGARYFSLLQNVQTGFGAHPSSYLFGTKVLSPEVKVQSCGFDHSSLYSAEFKNEWSYTSTPAICLYGIDGENFNIFTCIKPHAIDFSARSRAEKYHDF